MKKDRLYKLARAAEQGGAWRLEPPKVVKWGAQPNDLLITTINYYGCSLHKNTWLSSVLLSLSSLKNEDWKLATKIESVGLGDNFLDHFNVI